MSEGQIITVMQDAIQTILIVSLPMLGIGLVVGLIISVLQATTQIHEQTLVFVAKIFSIFISLILFGPWMLQMLQEFILRIFSYIQAYLG